MTAYFAFPAEAVQLYASCAALLFVAVTALWAIGLREGNHSLMDPFFGWSFALLGWIAYFSSGNAGTISALLVTMSSLHGVRLGLYLLRRWLSVRRVHGGDPRYLSIAEHYRRGYWWKSFVIVAHSQTVIILLVALPLVFGIAAAETATRPLGMIAFAGIAAYGLGLYFEWVGDGQLIAFKADPANNGRYLETGLWALTRHPNYFGNSTLWWGLWLVAIAGNPGLWWTVVGPLFNTFMLTRLVGAAFQDRFMGSRPAYRDLMARRNRFWPKLG